MTRRLCSRTWLTLTTAALLLAVIVLLSPERTRALLVSSLILATGAAALALPIGAGLAVALARFQIPGRNAAVACLAVLLFMPLLAQLSGWDAIGGLQGWQTLLFGQMSRPLLAGMRGAIFVHAMAAVPWAALIVGLGLQQVDPAQEEAALTVLPPPAVLRLITLPQAAPFFMAAALWIVAGTTAEMTVTNIYLVNTYTEDFYNTFAATSDSGQAALSVLPGALSLAILLAAALLVLKQLPLRGLRSGGRARRLWPLDPAGWILAGWTWLVIVVLLAVPLVSLVYKAGFAVAFAEGKPQHGWSAAKFFGEMTAVPERFGNDAGWTAIVAMLAATLATGVALLLAWQAHRGGWCAGLVAATVVAGLVIPGPLVGVALIWLLRRPLGPEVAVSKIDLTKFPDLDVRTQPLLEFLYDRSVLAPVLAQAIRALPLVTLLLWHSFRSLDDDILSAAALDGAGPWRRLWRIALPQRWPAVAAAWLAAVAIAAGDLAWSYLVLPPGLDMLQRRIFGLVHSGVEEQVASLSLVMIAASAVLALGVLRLIRPKV